MTETLTPIERNLPATLREWARTGHTLSRAHIACLMWAAAEIERLMWAPAEIERLTAENALLREERIAFGKTVDLAVADGGAKIERLTAENDRLWGDLAELAR